MSFAVFAIAACHALPPIVGAAVKGKFGLIIGATIGVIAGVLLGGSNFLFFDLVGVAVGYYIGNEIAENKSQDFEFQWQI